MNIDQWFNLRIHQFENFHFTEQTNILLFIFPVLKVIKRLIVLNRSPYMGYGTV